MILKSDIKMKRETIVNERLNIYIFKDNSSRINWIKYIKIKSLQQRYSLIYREISAQMKSEKIDAHDPKYTLSS